MRLHRGGIDRFGKEASEDRIGRRGIGLDGDNATAEVGGLLFGQPISKTPVSSGEYNFVSHCDCGIGDISPWESNLGIQNGMQINFR